MHPTACRSIQKSKGFDLCGPIQLLHTDIYQRYDRLVPRACIISLEPFTMQVGRFKKDSHVRRGNARLASLAGVTV